MISDAVMQHHPTMLAVSESMLTVLHAYQETAMIRWENHGKPTCAPVLLRLLVD